MATVPVKSFSNEKVGDLELDARVFEAPVKKRLFYEVVKSHLASRRRGTHATKTRAFVSGGGKKPFRQKGTGRARQGSSRSPLMPGGATVFGPQPRSYAYQVPRKVRQAALRAALSLRQKEGKLVVVDRIELPEIKTRALVEALRGLDLSRALIVTGDRNENLEKSARNLKDFKVVSSSGMTLFDLLRFEQVLLTRPAYDQIVGRLQA